MLIFDRSGCSLFVRLSIAFLRKRNAYGVSMFRGGWRPGDLSYSVM